MENSIKRDIRWLVIFAVLIVATTFFIIKFYTDTLPEVLQEDKTPSMPEVYPDDQIINDIGDIKG